MAGNEDRIPSLFHAFEYVDALASVAARNYAMTDNKNSQVEFRTYWDAGHILLMRHNDMIIEGYYRTHPLPATEQAVQSCQ